MDVEPLKCSLFKQSNKKKEETNPKPIRQFWHIYKYDYKKKCDFWKCLSSHWKMAWHWES